MVTKYVNQPLGMGYGTGMEGARIGASSVSCGGVMMDCAFAGRPKLWIPVVLAAASLATSIAGGAASSAASRRAEARQRRQEAEEDTWYKRRYNEDYVDTAAGQNLVRRAKDYARENVKRAEGARAVAGGTDAATAQAKEAGNRMVGDTIANIAATDQQQKAQVDNMHRQAGMQFAQMDIARENQRAQNIAQTAQGASNALASGASAFSAASQGNNNGVNLNGSDNGGFRRVAGGGHVYSDGKTVLNLTDIEEDVRRGVAALR